MPGVMGGGVESPWRSRAAWEDAHVAIAAVTEPRTSGRTGAQELGMPNVRVSDTFGTRT